ncbi:MAG: type I restriction enzyme HsdR N-terminal domain-containing protein [Ignavibacteria bacterium]|nr:type I restriction enzyme HsdR N-terminal domain-containing protein [Ignavibacteria bacterium]
MKNELVFLPSLIFPTYQTRISNDDMGTRIYDEVRKKLVALTPEEWVRQHCIHWFVSQGYPLSRCSVERTISKTGMRFDVLWLDANLHPFMLIECKAPNVKVSDHTLRQSGWYNLTLRAPYMFLTNGREAHCAKITRDGYVDIIPDIPKYPMQST